MFTREIIDHVKSYNAETKIRFGEQCTVHSALWTTETSYLNDKYCLLDCGAKDNADHGVGYKTCPLLGWPVANGRGNNEGHPYCEEAGETLIGIDNAKF